MRVLIYGLNFAPELTGIGKYTGEMVEWLAGHGYEVRVVTAPPYYPAWKVPSGYSATQYKIEHFHGATVYRCPIWVPEKPRGFSRIIHLFSFALASFPVMLYQMLWRPQVVLTVEPAFFCAPATTMIATLTGAASWLHVQDFEIDAAFELGLLPARGFVHWFALAFEKFFTCQFDRVSSISPNMVRRSLTKGVLPERAILFPNWVDTDNIKPLPQVSPFRKELGIAKDEIVLLYSGNMGMKQGLEMLPLLAHHFAFDARVKFLFCGDGAYRVQLEESVKDLGNVVLLPLQPLERLNDLLNTADIHLLLQKGNAADLVMPSKLSGMLASGRPVVATAEQGTQVADVVAGAGIVVPCDDLEAFYAAVRRLVDDAALRQSLGETARRFAVEHMGREHILQPFAAEIEKLATRRSG